MIETARNPMMEW